MAARLCGVGSAFMKINSPRLFLIFWLRRFPRFYGVARAIGQGMNDFFFGLLRKVIPASVPWGPPKGFFSAYELLQSGQLQGRVLASSQDAPPLPPDSLRRKCGLNKDLLQPWPIFWTLHAEARLIGEAHGLLDGQKRLSLEGSFGPIAQWDPTYRNLFLPPATRLKGNWTSITSRFADGFYHWFLEALPRLALLPEWPPDTRIIVPPRLASYQRQSLGWLGLEKRIRPTAEEHLLIERYYFCPPTAMTGGHNPFAVQFLRRSFLPRADLNYAAPPRFYLRRVGKYRPLLNEEEVVDFFQKRGWAIVDTEQLPLARQIALFARAEMICAPHGAGLTNLLWCPPGCQVLELCASTFLNGVYEGLAEGLALRYRHLIFEGDNTYQSRVNLAEVARALDF
jgi:capsular polysaccharide biosynthesis protein